MWALEPCSLMSQHSVAARLWHTPEQMDRLGIPGQLGIRFWLLDGGMSQGREKTRARAVSRSQGQLQWPAAGQTTCKVIRTFALLSSR